ncbi:SurA N-terminal domain-containing protein [Brevibacterium jeotgali]|uniref:Peptidyl-prolyl cis-trans isomerase SurA n=1 Tax=Brevibacterium jeotgali TaxID=1262550 RepID=A0A2H1L7L8_9MICO|nr:SurA N-terminal domain-containing protein [Brevibacterium jeotgali]TWC03474.1 peptidyl-prolyl cis-trans isomerase SurA [Brevibacterium jeotgali]SMY12904.1 peptidyl-prolyl cis-trans isomerase SurA [Brevibacterium jeotgali]
MQFRTMGMAIGATGFALAVAACGGSGGSEAAPEGQESPAAEQGQDPAAGGGTAEGEQPAAPEPDLEGVPDVVADVNGTEITKDEFTGVYESQFQQMAMQSQASGQEVDQDKLKSDTLDSLIGVELLEQEAGDRGIEVSDSQIEEALTETAEKNQMSADDFIAAMEEQGMPEDEVRSQVASQETVGQLVEDENGGFEASDDELKEAYDQAKSQQEQMAQQPQQGQQGAPQQPQEMPPFEEVKPQLEDQVTQQKQAEATDALATELREGADVTVNL